MKKEPDKPLPVFCILILLMYFVAGAGSVQAQEHKLVVQLSGLITTGDSTAGVAGVTVYVPHTNRGTYTNASGFFSLPVLPGDSVVVAALGYQKQYLLIPNTYTSQSYSTLLQLHESPTQLPTVDVMPWATERDLRVAISKVVLPKETVLKVDLGPLKYKSVLHGPEMDAGKNATWGIQQQLRQLERRHFVPSDVRIFGIPIR